MNSIFLGASFPINFYTHKKLDMSKAAGLLMAAGAKVGSFGKSFGAGLWAYYTNPVWIAMQLVQWGMSRAEAKRIMEVVTEPRRGSDGTLLIQPGEFPFPRGLYEAISRPEKLKTKKIKILYASMQPNDIILFEYLYIPIKYATLTRSTRKQVSIEMKNMNIKSFDRPIIEKRLSVHDLRDPYIVSLAIRVDGSKNSPRTKEWVTMYSMYKALNCIDVARNSNRNACLKSHNAMVKKRKLDRAKRMIQMRRMRNQGTRTPRTPQTPQTPNR